MLADVDHSCVRPSIAEEDGSVPLGSSGWSRKGHAIGIEVAALDTAEAQKEFCAFDA